MSSHAPSLPPRERLCRLALARSRGIGPRLWARLLDRFGSGERALAELPRLVASGRLPRVVPADPETVAREWARAEALGIRLVLRGEGDYPARLHHLEDPPPVVALAGDPATLRGPAVAVVGARHAGAAGMALARELAAGLAAAGVTVVSGLARGIDAAAHEGSLTVDGRAVAVLASGLDRVYPPEHGPLQARIRRHGLLLSERALGAAPKARHFPRRNRLIAALVDCVVVVEAAERSGSLMTARLAAELGREVAAVPGGPGDPRHRGTNRLLREGAHLVEGAEDVLALLAMSPRSTPPAPPAGPRASASGDGAGAPVPASAATPAGPPAPGSLCARLRELLGPEPLALDELARAVGRTAGEVREALAELELSEPLEWHAGDRVARLSG